jgi:hypothetical protein
MALADLSKLYGTDRVHESQLAFATLDDQGAGKLTMVRAGLQRVLLGCNVLCGV